MFKVYSIHGNKIRVLTDTFFVKIDRKITWLRADKKMNHREYFSDKIIEDFISQSAYANELKTLKAGQKLDIKYGSCSNHYHVVKMTEEEIQALNELEAKSKELKSIKEEIKKAIPISLINKELELEKEIKKLAKATM